MSERPYSFVDFLADFDAIEADGGLRQGPFGRVLGAAAAHFRSKYTDQRECILRYGCFMMALDFVGTHIRELDQEDLAVYGSRRVGALVSRALLEAVHELFTTMSPSQFDSITPSAVLDLARRIRSRPNTGATSTD